MLSVLLAIHMIACVALVIAVMLQRSEGGALGMSGGGTGGIISGRGAAGVLVKVTMGLAAVFFITSVVMTRLNSEAARAPTDIERQLRGSQGDAFDPLTGTAAPAMPTAPATTPDPLAPLGDAGAPPAQSTAPASPPATAVDPLAPVLNPQPSQPVTTPESGGSANP